MTSLIVGPNQEEVFGQIIVRINSHLETDFSVHPHEITDADIHALYDPEATSYGVEPTRAFIKKLQKRPFKRKNQIGIIPRIDMVTVEAQNALLKELEDHNASVIYILGALNEQNVLVTILSRAKITYINSRKKVAAEEELEKLAISITKKPQILSTFKKIADIEWTKQKALHFLEVLYQVFLTSEANKENLELLQQSGKLLNANIPARQVVSYILLRLNH